MNQLNPNKNNPVLNRAIDLSIEAATQLHLSDDELMALLIEHLHPVDSTSGNVVCSNDPARQMFNPLAGP